MTHRGTRRRGKNRPFEELKKNPLASYLEQNAQKTVETGERIQEYLKEDPKRVPVLEALSPIPPKSIFYAGIEEIDYALLTFAGLTILQREAYLSMPQRSVKRLTDLFEREKAGRHFTIKAYNNS